MKKSLFFTALAALMVLVFSSCTDNKELLANMVGTYCDNDPEETVTIQFYPSADGHTGRFIEVRTFFEDMSDGDDIEINVHGRVYITGTYTLTDERRLSYKYDLDDIGIFYDDDDMEAYADRNIAFNDANGNKYDYQGVDKADIIATLESMLEKPHVELWKEFYTSENKDFETLSYSDVQCDGKTFSYNANDTRITYTREDEDMFDANFFDKEKNADSEGTEAAEEEAEAEE